MTKWSVDPCPVSPVRVCLCVCVHSIERESERERPAIAPEAIFVLRGVPSADVWKRKRGEKWNSNQKTREKEKLKKGGKEQRKVGFAISVYVLVIESVYACDYVLYVYICLYMYYMSIYVCIHLKHISMFMYVLHRHLHTRTYTHTHRYRQTERERET